MFIKLLDTGGEKEGQEDNTMWSFFLPVHFTSKVKTELSATLNSNHYQRKQSDFDAIFKISGKDSRLEEFLLPLKALGSREQQSPG